jgi:hypothetical protein
MGRHEGFETADSETIGVGGRASPVAVHNIARGLALYPDMQPTSCPALRRTATRGVGQAGE